jgi:hypothetical protein
MFIHIQQLLQLSTEASDGPFAQKNLVVANGSERATGEKGSENTYMPAPSRLRFSVTSGFDGIGTRWIVSSSGFNVW